MDDKLAVNNNELDRVSNGVETKLVLVFGRGDGSEVSLTFQHCKQDCSNTNIKALMEGIVSNGAIYEKTPVSVKRATIVTTEKIDVDLS